jgi:uncharacterized repeat protein (TIGR03803 family)
MRLVRATLFLFFCAVAARSAAATTIARVVGFTFATGGHPQSPLLQASDGNFYGTTTIGGDDGAGCAHQCQGTVFQLTPQGQLTVLHTFAYTGTPAYRDGSIPLGGLVEGPDGWLYGTTSAGGDALSYGIVYKISKTGQFVKLHDFCPASPCPDGQVPAGELVFGPDGWLYGTTSAPLANPRIFRISTDGDYEAVGQFAPTSLSGPRNGLVLASDGAFYGLSQNGIYRFVLGVGITTLHLFGAGEGLKGAGPMVQGRDGLLYGATYEGGSGTAGTVFRIATDGTGFQKIIDLTSANEGTGGNAVIQASDGNIWGTTQSTVSGSVYSITTSGTFLQHALFTSDTGKTPVVHAMQAADGKLYGTTYSLGPSGYGAVYVVDAGLAPPAPGEAAPGGDMRVTAYDKATGDITVSYGPACQATDHHIVYGPLSGVATYAYSGQACGVGAFGTATFRPGAGSFFWVIVGNTPALEGSYGRASSGAERPEASGLAGCDYPQDLTGSCP